MELIKNKTYIGECNTIGLNGEGIVRMDGFTLFVDGMLPKERGKILITKLKKNYGYGKLIKLLEKSSERREPVCPYYKTCGGCSLQHMSYKLQLEYKHLKVKDCIERIGGFKDIDVSKTIGMDKPFNYRNKAQYPVGKSDGKAIIGFYSPRSHRITDIDRCMLQNSAADEVIGIVKKHIDKYNVSVYDETSHKGLIRHIVTRIGFSSGEIMVTIVINGDNIYKEKELLDDLVTIKGLASVVLNINKEDTNVILGGKCKTLWGKDTIKDSIGTIDFDISPLSFYQVNPVQTEKLYSIAVDAAGLTGNERVIDVYCGIGTISLFAARKAKSVLGIEVVKEAVEDAKHNAELNGIANVEFIAGMAEDVLLDISKKEKADVVFVDPPRKGLEIQVIDGIVKINPEKIVCVSCDPATLSRDLKIICENGYEIKMIQPVDQFCQTGHVETVVLLTKK